MAMRGGADRLRSLQSQFNATCQPLSDRRYVWGSLATPASPVDPVDLAAVQREFNFSVGDVAMPHGTPAAAGDDAAFRDAGATGDDDAAADDGTLPCTAAVQARLWQHQSTSRSGFIIGEDLSFAKVGFGAIIAMFGFDLLRAIRDGKTFAIQGAFLGSGMGAPGCPGRRWSCVFLPPTNVVPTCGENGTTCLYSRNITLHSKRTELPTLSEFLGPTLARECGPRIERWAATSQARSYYFAVHRRAPEPIAHFMHAQASRFLLRGVQPWVSAFLREHLPLVLPRSTLPPSIGRARAPNTSWTPRMPIIYVNDRGLDKNREYYNHFKCHGVRAGAYEHAVPRICAQLTGSNRPECVIYISGSTSREYFERLTAFFQERGFVVASLWLHPAMAKGFASRQWGVQIPGGSWIDLAIGGFFARGWVGIAQSNWIRMVEYLRATEPQGARCPFVDMGFAMLSEERVRQQHCFTLANQSTEQYHGETLGAGFLPDPAPSQLMRRPCLIVSTFAGGDGLADRLFEVANVVAVAALYYVPYVIPANTDAASFQGTFRAFVGQAASASRCAEVAWSGTRPGDSSDIPTAPMSRTFADGHSAQFSGGMKTFARPLTHWHAVREEVVGNSSVPFEFKRRYPGRNIMVGHDESRPVTFAHYERAIPRVLPAGAGAREAMTVHLFSTAASGSTEAFAARLRRVLESVSPGTPVPLVLHSGTMSSQDLLDMTACDDYVLSGSPLHAWAAFLSPSAFDRRGTVVRTNHSWLRDASPPPFWTTVDVGPE